MCSININILHYECHSISLTLLLFLSRRLYRYACVILCRHMCCVIVGIVYLYVFSYVPSYLHLSTFINLVNATEFIGSFFSWIPSFVECRSAFAANYSQVLSLDATWHIFGATKNPRWNILWRFWSDEWLGQIPGMCSWRSAWSAVDQPLLLTLHSATCVCRIQRPKKKDTRIH